MRAVAGCGGELATARSRIGRPDLVGRLTIASDGAGGFALVFSVCHSAADGHTCYLLLSMLSTGAAVTAVTAERKHDFDRQVVEATGAAEHVWSTSLPVNCNILCAFIGCWGQGESVALSFLVDPSKVAAVKAATPWPAAAYVSTNDILTSHFSNSIDVSTLQMAVNLRGRVPGPGLMDAGNYETVRQAGGRAGGGRMLCSPTPMQPSDRS
eukprot:SAG22_NODE_3548_length_1649_cov_3.999355_2_plen_211_part_00